MSFDFAALNLVGDAPTFRHALSLLQRVAACDATVLLRGETGTGKELAARAIHYLSSRRAAPFVPVNGGAIPETLVESELFGHIRGAFTDAKEAREGVIGQAHGGTLLLDEVDALCPRAQVALLRFLQDREIRPVGGHTVQRVDVRVIAATNADLSALVARGLFRQDLLFRLDLLSVGLPPLRERPGDPQVLAELFVARLSRQYGTRKTLHADALPYLASHSWPGNVRELENAVHREFLLGEDPFIRLAPARPPSQEPPDALLRPSLTSLDFRQAKARVIAGFERAYLLELLGRAQGNLSLAARLSGKERSRLGKLVRKHGLTPGHFSA